jgi:8-hydroxy-5-deazaflavin:NADPH oxidoreductase
MSYSIIGFGAVGQALARAFARKNIEVTAASRRPPDALVQQARAIGPTVVPTTLHDAIASDTIFLAVPFWEHREVAKQITTWQGKTIIDTTKSRWPNASLDACWRSDRDSVGASERLHGSR